MTHMTQINLLAPANSLGYGQVGQNITKELDKLCRVNFFPIGSRLGDIEDHNAELFNKVLDNTLTADFNSPCVKIWHQNQLFERIGNGKYYAFPIFELDTFTKLEQANLRAPDEIIVCSSWAKSVVQKYTDQPVHVVPLGVDTTLFQPCEQNQNPVYKFFNIGKTEVRKGHDILIECFNRAFDVNDAVELHMCWDNPFFDQNRKNYWHSLYKNSRLGNKVVFHGRKKSHFEIFGLVKSCDCAIMPSRAEGWNLELLEAMACGKPVIATNYSAHTEFCNDKNAFLIETPNLEPANDGVWFHGQGNWAYIGEHEKEQIIEKMRFCYKNRPYNKAGIETANQYSWKNSAEKIYGIINNTTV